MASNNLGHYGQHNGISLGNYKPDERMKQMLERCTKNLELARKNILKKLEQASKSNAPGNKQEARDGDVNRMEMDMLKREIEEFREDAKLYEEDAPHFTKRYRKLMSKGLKIQQDLDKMDVTGKDNLQEEKRQLIREVEEIWQNIHRRAHANACDGCEVKIV